MTPAQTERVSRRGYTTRIAAGTLLVATALGAAGFAGFRLRFDASPTAGPQSNSAGTLAESSTSTAPAFVDDPTISVPPNLSTTTLPDPTTSAAPTTTAVPILTEAAPGLGEPIGKIVIPAAQVDWLLVEGVGAAYLAIGPGHMPGTPLPGQPGNAVISGHRTTWGAPFNRLDRLVPGDSIEVETAIGTHTFEVRQSLVVEPTAMWVTDPRPGAWLTLTTCHPPGSARSRLVVFAELVGGPNAATLGVEPTGAQ